MDTPKPILVVDLFPPVLDGLLDVLASLTPDEWMRPTACEGWNVHDVALHLLSGEIGILSRKRDTFARSSIHFTTWDELVAGLNAWNAVWVEVTRRISPRVLCDVLALSGPQVCDYFASLDPFALGGPVNWAGPDPAPVWLDLARELTERWHHQQHIRDAVGKPGLTEPRFMTPILDAFARALPHTYREVSAPTGTQVTLTITGPAGGHWTVVRADSAWRLFSGRPSAPAAEVILDPDTAWRLFTKGLSPAEARLRVEMRGNVPLGEPILRMVSIIG